LTKSLSKHSSEVLPHIIPIFIVTIIYILIRGFLDPIRRSKDIFWWKKKPFAILIALVVGVAIDLSKTSGSFVAYVKKLIRIKSQ